MKKLVFTTQFLLLLLLVSCGDKSRYVEITHSDSAIKLTAEESLTNSSFSDDSDCRERIAEILCLVNPPDENNPYATMYNRPCLEEGVEFKNIFQAHYDQAHPVIKKLYCSLEKIWIENQLSTTAYATPIYDNSDTLVAAGIGIKKEFLLASPKLGDWFTEKEVTSYGNEKNALSFKTKKNNHSAVYYALNHEFGHILDYANKLNQYETPCGSMTNTKDCQPTQDSWSVLSWKNASQINQENDHPLFRDLCFYQCGGEYISIEKAPLIFEALFKTNFISTYSTINPKEDWAETFAVYLETLDEKLDLNVETPKKTFNLSSHFNSHNLKSKRMFIEKFLNSNIKYPGN